MIKLPASVAGLPNDTMVPADQRFVLHRSTGDGRDGRSYRAACGTRVETVPLVTMVAHGTGVCATCYPRESGMPPGHK